MFSISFLVDDRNLARCLTGLAGMARDLIVLPVINAEVKKGRNIIKERTGGSGAEMIVDWMRNKNTDEITGPEAKQALREMGLPTNSYSHYLNNAVKKKLLKKGKKIANIMHYSLVLLREDKA